jgi:hypothetical protein
MAADIVWLLVSQWMWMRVMWQRPWTVSWQWTMRPCVFEERIWFASVSLLRCVIWSFRDNLGAGTPTLNQLLTEVYVACALAWTLVHLVPDRRLRIPLASEIADWLQQSHGCLTPAVGDYLDIALCPTPGPTLGAMPGVAAATYTGHLSVAQQAWIFRDLTADRPFDSSEHQHVPDAYSPAPNPALPCKSLARVIAWLTGSTIASSRA